MHVSDHFEHAIEIHILLDYVVVDLVELFTLLLSEPFELCNPLMKLPYLEPRHLHLLH